MKLVVSSYNKDIPSLTYFNINLKEKEYQILDEKILNAPSFVIKNDDYIFTYSKEPIKLVSYKIIDDKLKEVDEMLIPGKTLTHLCYSKRHQRLYAASYLDGAYLMVDVKDGKFNNLKYFNQEVRPSKCHCVFLNNDESIVNVIDIEQDRVYQYDKDLKLVNIIELPKKCGPRHGIYFNDFMYIVTEYSNEVLVISDKNELIERVSTINGYQGQTFGATLLTIDNKLYASNRGYETIACFDIIDKKLKLQKMLDVYGNHSRHMIKTHDEKYIITFNKNSHNIVIIDLITQNKVMEIKYQNVSCGAEI